MSIGRVSGSALYSNLDRQGVDLQISSTNTNINETILYLDASTLQVAINTNTNNTNSTLTVNGNALIGQLNLDTTTISSTYDITLAPANNLHLGDLSSIKINGGSNNYIMSTDGAGNLSWQSVSSIAGQVHTNGLGITLGNPPSDQSLVNYSAYRYWTGNTSITDAIDNLNQVMLNVYKNTYVGQVDFVANVMSGPSPLTVQFTSTIVGNPNTYLWNFGDGTSSNVANPIHTFANVSGGSFTVYCKASNVGGTLSGAGQYGIDAYGLAQGSYADLEKVNYITLYTPSPIPSFTLDSININDGNVATLTNTSQYASSYVIHWGDGNITNIINNSVLGGAGAGPITHVYHNATGDATYQIKIDAYSPTAGLSGITVTSSTIIIYVYSTHIPTFTATPTSGNNQHTTVPNGLVVSFTNTTSTHPGTTSAFPGNKIMWDFGDGVSVNVSVGSGNAGDIGTVITHAFSLSNPVVGQTFNVTQTIYNGSSTSPFVSNPLQITVNPAPVSLFSGIVNTLSDRVGDNAQTGYMFTDLLGNNRASFNFTNSSYNTNLFTWNYGDSSTVGPLSNGVAGTPLGGTISHTYNSTGSFSVSLLATGTNSLSQTDDTNTKNNYITILPTPVPPAGLSAETLTIATLGNSPLLAWAATDNSGGSIPAAGTSVNRITNSDPVETNIINNVYNAYLGVLAAKINNVSSGSVTLTGANDTGTYGSLVITSDMDAHLVSSTTWPSNFYKVFSGKVSTTASTIRIGYNTIQMSHSLTGSTNTLGFIKDSVTLVPTLDLSGASATTLSQGTLLWMSGVPYFNTGGSIAINNVAVFNWIGQTYLNSNTPMSIVTNTVTEGNGNIISTQGLSYASINGSVSFINSGIPIAETGNVQTRSYTLGALPVSINGNSAASGRVKLSLSNVNGTSAIYELPVNVNTYSIPLTGFNELNIPVSPTLGSMYTDNGVRVYIAGAVGANPTYSPTTNYYVTHQFTGNVPVSSTDEAIARFGTLGYNVTDYSSFLPAGPNLSGRSGPQYFRFSFRRQVMANFTITYTGKISGLWIAAPGTKIDTTSTLNGWLSASSVYAGAGVPGSNTGSGGNGSNGCAKSAGDVIPTGQSVVNKSCIVTLGTANASDSYGNEILVNIEIGVTDFVTSISIS